MHPPTAPTSPRRRISRLSRRAALLLVLAGLPWPGEPAAAPAIAVPVTWHLTARIVAVGLPGVAGVRQIGRFHNGGPFPSNPEFLLQTDRGRILDPQRLMVAVASNFGAPAATPGMAPGSVLSIDPQVDHPLVVDARFAHAGGQAQDAHGAVQVYAAQSAAFLNERHNAGARTAPLTSVAGPRYVSINNAFGRPWIANAPAGTRGEGSLSVVDPDGAPLANAPSDDAGGVFAGHRTNRRQVAKGYASSWFAKAFNYRDSAQLTAGSLDRGALGTAFLGAAPDGSGLAVFATATADGAIEQVHVQDGVDGLAPAGSVLRGDDDGVIGMAFKWNPQRALYVADAGRNQILLLALEDDRRQFRVVGTTHIASPWFNQPVDLAATLPEIANPAFASHTTLAGGSDLYVANRGDGSLLRITQDGTPVARALIDFADGSTLGAGRIRAIAVSADARRLWLTVQGDVPGFAGHEGALIEVNAFDAGGLFGATAKTATGIADRDLAAAGENAFRQVFTPQAGLGPLFNEQSCVACHPGPGGASTLDAHFARRVARMNEVTGRVSTVDHPNSPVARRHSTLELGEANAPLPTLPHDANLSSLRMPIALYNTSAIEQVADAAIEAQAVSKGDGIKGRVHYVAATGGDLKIGRFGWKADIATLEQMVADAFGNELGITSALAAHPSATAKDDGRLVRAVAAYLRVLVAPSRLPTAAAPPHATSGSLAPQP